MQSKVRDIYVVLGAYKEIVQAEVEGMNINIIDNPEWPLGMSSSIQKGINHVCSLSSQPDAILIMLCDQPLVYAEALDKLIDKYCTSDAKIVNCHYGESFGPPVLFDQSLFVDLQNLQSADGAKEVVQKNRDVLQFITLKEGVIDIDTENDYRAFLARLH